MADPYSSLPTLKIPNFFFHLSLLFRLSSELTTWAFGRPKGQNSSNCVLSPSFPLTLLHLKNKTRQQKMSSGEPRWDYPCSVGSTLHGKNQHPFCLLIHSSPLFYGFKTWTSSRPCNLPSLLHASPWTWTCLPCKPISKQNFPSLLHVSLWTWTCLGAN